MEELGARIHIQNQDRDARVREVSELRLVIEHMKMLQGKQDSSITRYQSKIEKLQLVNSRLEEDLASLGNQQLDFSTSKKESEAIRQKTIELLEAQLVMLKEESEYEIESLKQENKNLKYVIEEQKGDKSEIDRLKSSLQDSNSKIKILESNIEVSEFEKRITNNQPKGREEVWSPDFHQEEEENTVLSKLQEERRKLEDAQRRIYAANKKSSKSLELAVAELQTMKSARHHAERRADMLEDKVERVERDMTHLRASVTDLNIPKSLRELIDPASESKTYEHMYSTREIDSFNPASKQVFEETHPSAHVQKSHQQFKETHPSAHVQKSHRQFEETHPSAHVQTSHRQFEETHPSAHVQKSHQQLEEPRKFQAVAHQNKVPVFNEEESPQETSWAKSRESLAPFATNSSTRDLQKGFSLLERKLMMLNIERDTCQAEFNKLINKGSNKTKRGLDEKIRLEEKLEDLSQEISNVRIALRKQPK